MTMFSIPAVILALIILICLKTLITARTCSYPDYKPETCTNEAAERLAKAVRIKTVSHSDYSLNDLEKHREFQKFLKDSFPAFHSTAERTVLSDYGIIYKWPGRSEKQKALLFIAHYDVVPADDSKWTHPPFDGKIIDGYIWGRGTLDTKNTLMGMLEAAESLCKEGFIPKRDTYFAFGGDEETEGHLGAVKIAAHFKSQGISFEWLHDEGSIIADGIIKGVNRKLALIGTAEKGYADILLRTEAKGGHAAMPPAITATGRIARAVTRIEKNPFPMRWIKTTRKMFSGMSSGSESWMKVVLANIWLFGPVIKLVMGKAPQSAALLRTTTAPTMIKGSSKENVLAETATAVINTRVLSGDTLETVLARIRKVIKDESIEVSLLNPESANNPVSESSTRGQGYKIISRVISETVHDALILPYLNTGTTDSKAYIECCENIYRLAPMILQPEDVESIHASNEKISLENYGLVIRFYKTMFQKINGEK